MPSLTTQKINISETNDLTQLVRRNSGVLYLDARKANGNTAGINSPLTNPWKDMSGYGNDATLYNFAETISDGYAPQLILSRIGAGKQFVNLLGDEGNFEGADLTAWTISAGSPTLSTDFSKTGTKSLKIAVSASAVQMYKEVNATNGDKIYTCCFGYLSAFTSGSSGLGTYDKGGANVASIALTTTTLNSWQFLSNLRTAANGGIRVFLGNFSGSQTLTEYYDCVMSFNLKDIFGAGNEPTQAQMDVIIQSAIAKYGYINNNILQIAAMDFLKTDGSDSYGAMANTPSMDITGDFAFCTAFIMSNVAGTGWFISKALDGFSTTQYGIYWDASTKLIYLILDGAERINSFIKVETNQLIKLEITRISGALKVIINDVVVRTGTYNTALTTRPNLRLFVRVSNAGGTTHVGYLNIYVAYETMLSNPKSDSNVAKITKELCKNYLP